MLWQSRKQTRWQDTCLQNCDTQEHTNYCTTVQGTDDTTSGVLLTGLVTLSKEGHSKHCKGTTKGDQNDSLHICPNLRGTSEAYGLISLENRRLRTDLLEVFKIMKGFVKVNPAAHFSMIDRRSRGHTLKLEMPRARLDIRKHFFSSRVIDAWNALPGHMVEATSTNMFKAALQRRRHGAFRSWKQLPAPRGHLTTRRMASHR